MLEPSQNNELPPIPAKRYFTIGEVSELCDVKPHVLRYWEQEFPQLKPVKRRGNRRYYQRQDVLTIRQIRSLLYDQGFTIGGARQQMSSEDAKEDATQFKQLVKQMIAYMERDYQSSRLLYLKAGWMKNNGVRNTRETALAKWVACDGAERSALRHRVAHRREGDVDLHLGTLLDSRDVLPRRPNHRPVGRFLERGDAGGEARPSEERPPSTADVLALHDHRPVTAGLVDAATKAEKVSRGAHGGESAGNYAFVRFSDQWLVAPAAWNRSGRSSGLRISVANHSRFSHRTLPPSASST